ncbi:MAG: glutamate--tRNA ligase [Nitrososphaerales archaeon]
MLERNEEQIENLAKKYALLNALAHGGRADQGSVVGRMLAENADLRGDAKHVRALVAKTVGEVNAIDVDEQSRVLGEQFPQALEQDVARKKEASRQDSEKTPSLPELPDATKGCVVTRFPPEPNGYMHIGHAKAATIGFDYAKKYEGRFIVRFDDTNPAAEKKEYYSAFLESLDWLGIKPDLVRNASDDMERFYELAEQMMTQKKAFVCTCTQEKMKQNRAEMAECDHRSQTPEQNILLWEKMLAGEREKSTATLRFAGDMKSVNTTMRDPVLFRIVEEAHPLRGNQFRVWPTYDFDGPIEDSLDGVTHAMRSKEYELRDELYTAILGSLELRVPKVIEFSRLSLQNTTVSKRSLRKFIESGEVEGWDDPRLPTISGLRRRGFLPYAIREFILSMGVSKVESEPTWDLLESINRKLLDPIAKRYFFVADPVRLKVSNAPKLNVNLKNHPEKEMGERTVLTEGNFLIARDDAMKLKVGSEVRLIEAYNLRITSVEDGKLEGIYHHAGKLERVQKIQWVSEQDKIHYDIVVTGPLLLDEKYNPDSLKIVSGAAEGAVASLPQGEIIQFVRFGFCRMDKPGTAIMAHK